MGASTSLTRVTIAVTVLSTALSGCGVQQISRSQESIADEAKSQVASKPEGRAVVRVSRGGVKEPGMGGVMAPAEPGVKRGFERFQGCGFLPFLATA
ncbi:hypothetical protein LGM61_41070, partial [Burkholderia cepacia]|nr:hypothetical protein [Burkholderia cepacia]